jgi:hypothetical protein
LGTSDSQKGLLKTKSFWLVVLLLASGAVMKYFGPAGKLDGRYFYTINEAKTYLEGLSALDRSNYLFGEIVDYWFMINYSWLFFLAFRKKWVFLPLILDFCETTLIVIFLISGEFYAVMRILPFLSVPKWFMAAALFALLLVQLIKKRFKL